MAEKLTPFGLVVGLIPEEDPAPEQEAPVQEPAPAEEQPAPQLKRGRKAKA